MRETTGRYVDHKSMYRPVFIFLFLRQLETVQPGATMLIDFAKHPSKQKPGFISKSFKNKKARLKRAFLNLNNYLFITYIVTSKPKRISVAAGVVHMMFILLLS